MNVRELLRERAGAQGRARGIPGGPSFAHTLGYTLALLLAIEAVTGAGLAMFYSPSTTTAWASVAYVQDQVALGWLVRGLHFHGASALVIVSGLHLVQTALYGAYKRPRELVWWLGILLLLLVLAFAVTGYVLRWDQAGYWANRVEVGIAAATPIVGGAIRKLALGGNEYGNLTLTRFYALHAVVLPAVTTAAVIGHVALARRHGATPRPAVADDAPGVARWPAQAARDALVMAMATAVLIGYTVGQHGADLATPADPSSAFDARPLWYFRWLYELRELAGSMEKLAALAAPAVVGGLLVALPLLDRRQGRAWKPRLPWLGALAGLCALVGGLTVASLVGDRGDAELAKRQAAAAKLADRARSLAAHNGVPVTGAQDVWTTVPMYRARTLYATRCKGCHDEASNDRKGPIIAAGHGNRAWLKGFLRDPSGAPYWGKTKLATTEDAMGKVTLPDPDLDALVELLYAQSGASDVDAAKRDHGKDVFDKACSDCHSIDEGMPGTSGPGLGGLGSRDYDTSFISNPKSALHMTAAHSQMPRFDQELSIVDRDALAGYLVWLRSATPADVAALGEL